jgi:hypothetical protein
MEETPTEGEEEKRAMASATKQSWESSCRKAWALHFIICLVVMLSGILHNGNVIKLIPSRLRQEDCQKILINVLSPIEEDGTVCCSANSDTFSLLCSKVYLPLYTRLTRLPDAWIISLFPIIIRGLALVWQTVMTNRPSESWTTYLQRFNLYLVMIALRGFVLFLGLNWVEEQIVGGPSQDCWFSEYARRGPTCKGVEFDFSDHTVLYLGQILSIPLTEIIYWWLVPIGSSTLSKVVSGAMMYLYFITLLGEFQTAAYYHTACEVLVGYAISLLIQLPLAYTQCYSTWGRVRANLFGLSTTSSERQD